MQNYGYIRCRISRGAFSSERAFSISTPSGELEGLSDVGHLLSLDGTPLGLSLPVGSEVVEGLVKCRILQKINEELLVDLPGLDVVAVAAEDVERDVDKTFAGRWN